MANKQSTASFLDSFEISGPSMAFLFLRITCSRNIYIYIAIYTIKTNIYYIHDFPS